MHFQPFLLSNCAWRKTQPSTLAAISALKTFPASSGCILCSRKVLLRPQHIWQRRPPDIGATSTQDKQLALSVHRKPVTFLVVLNRRMS